MEMSKGGDPTVLCPTGQGEAQGCQRKIQFSLLLERCWTQGWWEGCEWVGSRARTGPLLYTKTHQCLHKGCSRDKGS